MKNLSKENCIQELDSIFSETIDWMNALPSSDFNKHFRPQKWSPAQHYYHLIKSTRAVNKGLKLPKLALRTMFGKNNRTEKTYDELVHKYQTFLQENEGIQPAPEFVAKDDRVFEQAALSQRFNDELDDMKSTLEKWDEKNLSTYLLVHPAIGKLTIREMIYFTIYHTGHHLNNLKKELEMNIES